MIIWVWKSFGKTINIIASLVQLELMLLVALSCGHCRLSSISSSSVVYSFQMYCSLNSSELFYYVWSFLNNMHTYYPYDFLWFLFYDPCSYTRECNRFFLCKFWKMLPCEIAMVESLFLAYLVILNGWVFVLSLILVTTKLYGCQVR